MIDFIRWLLAADSAKIGRVRYIATNLSIIITTWLLALLLAFFDIEESKVELFEAAAGIFLLAIWFSTSAKRLRDLSLPPIWAVVALIPLFNFAFMAWLAIKPRLIVT